MIKKPHINPLIYILVAWFGSAAWLGSFSAWVEMSIFVQHLPEGWSLASVLIVTIQCSAIAPLIFMILDRCIKIPIRHGIVIQIALIVCAAMYIPMFLAWDAKANIFGSPHSITLISTIFVLGSISISSDLVFLPYMATFGDQYLPAYFVGASVSGLLPSALSIAQGSSTYTCALNPQSSEMEPVFKAPRFSVSTFYIIIFAWVCGGVVSFFILNNYFHRLDKISARLFRRRSQSSGTELVAPIQRDVEAENEAISDKSKYRMSRLQDICMLICIAFGAGQMNTLLPSVQSFASLPYSQETYFWGVILTTVCQPFSAFLAGIFPVRSFNKILILLAVCTFGTFGTTIIALQSPNPWLKSSLIGSLITVFLQLLSTFTGVFLRTVMVETFRDGKPEDDSRLFWAGLSAQAGSLIGTLVVFPSVNFFHFFTAAPQC